MPWGNPPPCFGLLAYPSRKHLFHLGLSDSFEWRP